MTALAALVLATRHRPLPVFLGAAGALTIQSAIAVGAVGRLRARQLEALEWEDVDVERGLVNIHRSVDRDAVRNHPPSALSTKLASGMERAQLVRLDADALRLPGRLIPYGAPLVLHDRGSNLAGLYDAVRDRGVERFMAISKRVTELFPTVKTLGLRAIRDYEKVLMVTLIDGTEVPAEALSEGLLYYLAFAVLAELQRPAVYLVEEPENGLHPSRIADIVRMLRTIAEDPEHPVQVLMATHSPLIVNELLPEEVTIVTRDPVTGTRLRPIKETPHFEERSKVYALGELWLSYADGKSEAPLFDSEGR